VHGQVWINVGLFSCSFGLMPAVLNSASKQTINIRLNNNAEL